MHKKRNTCTYVTYMIIKIELHEVLIQIQESQYTFSYGKSFQA
jgi:hypothetical protein